METESKSENSKRQDSVWNLRCSQIKTIAGLDLQKNSDKVRI